MSIERGTRHSQGRALFSSDRFIRMRRNTSGLFFPLDNTDQTGTLVHTCPALENFTPTSVSITSA